MAPTKKHGCRPPRDNLLEGLTNLETGEPAPAFPRCYASMKAAAHALKLDIGILKDARSRACPAFESGGAVHREKLLTWLRHNADTVSFNSQSRVAEQQDTPEDFEENYQIPDEAGGVGQTLKSLQAYERRAKRFLDETEKSTKLHPSIKAEAVKRALDAWLKVVGQLLKYDLAVDTAKRESGELIPIADAKAGVEALLAWHTIATSDALRNAIPDCEQKNKYEIAAVLDPCLRSAIYRNFKLGVKLGKVPDWMGKTVAEFVKSEPPLSINPPSEPQASKNIDDY